MQLDKTRIVIRERSYLDILDLALHVIRMHPWGTLLSFAAGALPLALLNYWLLSGMLAEIDFDIDSPVDYITYLLLLMVWEIPLAAAPLTLYLGQVLFMEKASVARLVRELTGSLPQLVLVNVLLRGMLMTLFLPLLAAYFFWPFATEVILLERNPLRRRHPQAATAMGRAFGMHKALLGEVIARWMGAVVIGIPLALVLWLTVMYVQGGFAVPELGAVTYSFCLPLSLWILLGYFTIVRFLSYLDVRIRTEGWEVELLVRAEAVRLSRQLA